MPKRWNDGLSAMCRWVLWHGGAPGASALSGFGTRFVSHVEGAYRAFEGPGSPSRVGRVAGWGENGFAGRRESALGSYGWHENWVRSVFSFVGEAARVEIGFANWPMIRVETPATRNRVRFANSGASADAWWQEAVVSEREIPTDVQRQRSPWCPSCFEDG